VRNLTDASFAMAFSLVLDATNAGRKRSHWQVGGVQWQRDRLTYGGPTYAFQCEVHTLRHTASPSWTLLYVMETWWDEGRKSVVRDNRWGRLLAGRKAEVLAWFRKQSDR
jgi:hypothetical protein